MIVYLSPVETAAVLSAARGRILEIEQGGAITLDEGLAMIREQRALVAVVDRLAGAITNDASTVNRA